MPVKLQYVQLITDKNNAADLLRGVFTILISVTQDNKNTKSIYISQTLSKTGKTVM